MPGIFSVALQTFDHTVHVARTWGLLATDIPALLPNSCAKLGKLIFRNNKLERISPLSKDWFAHVICLSLMKGISELHL